MGIPVRGCRDVGPVLAAGRRALVNDFAALAARYGFAEVETPIVERAVMYSTSLGATSEVVSAELFCVSGPGASAHRKGERDRLALRPEGTAGVARAFGQRGANRPPGETARVWYAGPMFRYERPQRLRLRQFSQLGVECLGDASIHADLDCISLAHSFLAKTPGGKGSSLVLNTLGTKEDRAGYNDAMRDWLAPRVQALSPLSRQRFEAGNCMRILDSKLAEDEDAMRGAPCLSEAVGPSERDRFELLKSLLGDEGVPFKVDPKLVRGLDYYSSTAFEYVDGDGRAVCAGGRYEGLDCVSGVGFAAGLERLEGDDAVDAAEGGLGGVSNGIAVLAILGSPESSVNTEFHARKSVRRLRNAGMCAMLWSVRSSKIGKAISRVVRDGARAVVVIGPDDIAKSVAQVKLLEGPLSQTRDEPRAVDLDSIVSVVQNHLGRS